MIKIKTRTIFHGRAVQRRVRASSTKPIRSAAAYLRTTAKRSIKVRKKASAPNSAPHTRNKARSLKKAIFFSMTTKGAVVGPLYSRIGRVGQTHEFGGYERRRKANFDLRIGGHGPIAEGPRDSGRKRRGKKRRSGLIVVELRSQRQVNRAKKKAKELELKSRRKPLKKYPARPFMGPALAITTNKMPGYWRGAVR